MIRPLSISGSPRESDCNSCFHCSNHVPQEICAFPHDILHEVIPSFVNLRYQAPDLGYGLFCPHPQVLILESSFLARLRQASERMVRDFCDQCVYFNRTVISAVHQKPLHLVACLPNPKASEPKTVSFLFFSSAPNFYKVTSAMPSTGAMIRLKKSVLFLKISCAMLKRPISSIATFSQAS